MTTAEVIGVRLKQARARAKLSLEELSDRMNGAVSKQSISNYERGATVPSSKKLIKFSEALGMPLDFFYRPILFDIEQTDISFRKKAGISAREQAAMKVAIQDEVERFMQLREIMNDESMDFVPVKPVKSVLRTRADMRPCAQKVRREWGLGSAPISNVQMLLEKHGVSVIFTRSGAKGMEGVSATVDGRPFIVLNANVEHCERLRLTALHELAYLLFNDYIANDTSKAEREKMCHAFANEMLLPTEVVHKRFAGIKHISTVEMMFLQEEYGISVDAIVLALRDLGIITELRCSLYFAQKNSDKELKFILESSVFKEVRSETFERDVYTALARGMLSESKAAALLNVPVETVHKQLCIF